MKLKILSLLIILCSLISGVLGAFFLLKFYPDFKKLAPQQEISKQNDINKTVSSNSNLVNLQDNITSVIGNISPSVVNIIIKKDLVVYRSDPWGFFRQPVGSVQEKVGGGSGFFMTKDGIILTNKHVVADPKAEYTVITSSGEEYDAQIVAVDPLTDLAVIKIDSEKEFTPLSFVQAESDIQIGQFGVAIGNALAEFQNSVSLGIVSGKNRKIKDQNINLYGLIQTDAAINPGNSGGPLINLDGKVMGVNTAIVGGSEGIGFAIVLTEAKARYMLDSIQKFGTIKRPFIGVIATTITPEIKEQNNLSVDYGAFVLKNADSIVPDSSAEKAGLKPGDIILKIDGIKIDANNSLVDIISVKIPGESVTLKVLKGNGEEKDISIQLGEY